MLKRPTSSNTISPLWDKLKSKPAPYLLAPKCSIRNPIYRTSTGMLIPTQTICVVGKPGLSQVLLCYCSYYVAGIATRYGLHGPEFEPRWGEGGGPEIFRIRQDQSQDPSSLCTKGAGSHSRGSPNHICLKSKNPIF